MRVPSSPLLKWLLVVGAVAAGAACAAEEAAPDEETFASESDITGQSNRMGLKLVYDETTRHVHATVRRKLKAGESLRLRVRRGRLTMDSQTELDCSQLPDAPALPLAEGTTKVTYDGPEVDPSLLASVYDEEWILGNVTPQMLDRLAREGADSIVEACIVKEATVKARLQTSLQYAWDAADPLAAQANVGRTSVAPGLHLTTGDVVPAATTAPARSMEHYADLCVRELGEIPFFERLSEGRYSTFDCRGLVGNAGPLTGIEGAPIASDAMVVTAKNREGAHWTLLCRKGAEGSKRFADISMIGHDPRSGKTCFFQNKLFDGTDGARIPHPADVEKARHVWDEPKGYCASCHSADAFVHSAWIDTATRRDGSTLVPTMGQHPDFPLGANAPYSIVHQSAQARGRVGGSTWEMPKQLVSDDVKPCTSCHRIGGGEAMRRLPLDAHPFASDLDPAAYAKAVTRIEACAAAPESDGCVWKDVPSQGQQ